MKKILIANRGEIALRIIRAVQEQGLIAVGVYETPDKEARHIRAADEAIWIGEGPRKDYLNIDKMIWAARKAGADGIHPGYGFLAENPDFPKACEDAGLIFIGPPAKVIHALGNKVIARTIAESAGVPVIPGSENLSYGQEGEERALAFAQEHGFPLMLKATAGGGGRGIRKVNNAKELIDQMPLARAEAKAAFNDGRIYLEKGVINPKHVEVQVLADSFGHIIHMGTRDCSIQRRNQKLVEIAPALIPDKTLLNNICTAAIKVAQEAHYVNAGTVEFLVDEAGHFYFLEMNTRLQVEHTVTEMVTGMDIVRSQIDIAAGQKLKFSQKDVHIRGHAIEMRINAEDPKNNFLPEGGKTITVYNSPGGAGIRLDGIVYQGYVIPQVYDSLLVKLTVHGFTWLEAVERMRRALKGFVIVGPKTTIPFYLNIVNEPDFQKGIFNTSYLDLKPNLFEYKEEDREVAKLAKLIATIHHKGFNPFAT
ncbi:MAG: biotin carboxylase N-terminal domain-containing protein [Thermodesulfobacteriota bacterium]